MFVYIINFSFLILFNTRQIFSRWINPPCISSIFQILSGRKKRNKFLHSPTGNNSNPAGKSNLRPAPQGHYQLCISMIFCNFSTTGIITAWSVATLLSYIVLWLIPVDNVRFDSVEVDFFLCISLFQFLNFCLQKPPGIERVLDLE